ncbi:ATP-dependent helicase Lhr and Lhr-like helicase [Thermomonospora echinospora]|uniref:ATP-dependent helicase Lhr and Lhr-like helicase n=1 Tax=Thermomonospora echinospora TaxID=1992 RepID=A0A1H6BKW5_9ACTN|nr:DEAD/DEAH box helicase [Thermomonospora echinospora]SEG61272.1 ATP-dependent helicase Lhr and Lhr-like helicase [Thermomonospora echinospora]
MRDDVLERFSPATRAWFTGAFAGPTDAQAGAWESIAGGEHTLVVAPTGSGKTLAAFLWSLDRLATAPAPPSDRERRCRVLYVSPLKALAVDVERNLRAPLTGIRQSARRLGLPEPDVRVGVRSGDTPADERRRLVTRPPDILITTPESLFLMLTSQARQVLRGVDTVIVDEVHAVAGTKRGAHLALSLERLDALLERPAQRIGLSATVRPVEEVAAFLGGGTRPAQVVQPPRDKRFDLRIVVPVEDMGEPGLPQDGRAEPGAGVTPRRSLWPHVEERVLDLIEAHRSTIVFANSRRQAERLCGRLNELAYEREYGPVLPDGAVPAELMAQAGIARGAPQEVARAHHGSVSKEERAGIEEALKQGRLPAVVATSSLELGIDMGAVDLVVQVGSPPSVAGGLQRVGRAGHQVGAVSKGVIFPKYRGDLVQTAVVAERMGGGDIEELHYPRNPLDVLAQQIVAMVAMDEWPVDELEATVRRAAPFATLPRSALEATLDMLAGRYPSEEFGELRPRLVWDRVTGTLRGRPGAQRLAVTSGGTIPDRGLFGVFLVGERTSRVGELDEEMVYESRVGDVFVLGASSWRIEDITPDRVLVSPAPGQPGKLPFWHGDSPGRPAELGRALGAFTRELSRLPRERAAERARAAGLDEWAAGNLVAYLDEQREATGHVPDDRTLVVERFRDELGDWRLVVHSPFGARVHAPWALAIAARLRERYGVDAQAMHADDGIVLRIPDSDEPPRLDLAVFDPDDIERIVVDELGSSALFAARFRECAARSLLLPRRRPDRRMPLWQQRQRAAQLLSVASKYASFPIVLETMRECLQDVFDVPGLVGLMRDLAGRKTRMVEVETPEPSPYARSLLFHYVGAFMYEGDAPLAERRAQALALDSALLAELLGQADLRELLDPEVVAETERELQRLAADRRARDAEGVADLLRALGPLSTEEVAARIVPPPAEAPAGAGDRVVLREHPSPAAVEADETPDGDRDGRHPSRPDIDGTGHGQVDSVRSAVPGGFHDGGVAPRARVVAGQWLVELEGARRVIRVRVAGAERWAAVEDAGRLRDALGVPLPVGVPEAFLEVADDPLGDLVWRYARTHGPFRAGDVAVRFGLGPAVVLEALRRQAAAGRVVEGEFLPVEALSGPVGSEWCDTGVLRTLRRRCLARLRAEVEPSPPEALGRFLPAWHGVGAGRLRGMDALVQAIEQVQGAAVPASALESLVLPSRVPGYSPALLDELTSAGEVVWAGQGALPGGDGWISLYLADTAPLLMPEPVEITLTPVHEAALEALSGGGALFFRTLSDRVNAVGAQAADQDLVAALWDLVWAGYLTNDTLAPLRAALGSGRPAHRPRPSRRGRPVLPSRTGPPTVAGRWWLLPDREDDRTRRSHALAETLLERHGVVIRGAVAAERAPGGFAAVYPVLRALEEAGRCRRGYFVEGLGAAQFALPGAVDRLRALREPPGFAEGGLSGDPWSPASDPWSTGRARPGEAARDRPRALVLAAADPANPYGAALPWPERDGEAAGGHKPGRKAGALVVLVDGALVLYIERGGRTLLSWADEPGVLQSAADALALAVREGALGKLTVERADGESIGSSPLAEALEAAGFHPTPRGLRLRA